MKFQTQSIVYNDGSKGMSIQIDIRAGCKTHTVAFKYQAESEMERDFLNAAVQEQFNEQIEQIRKAAYEAGWSDKTKHKAKCDWFGHCANTINPFG